MFVVEDVANKTNLVRERDDLTRVKTTLRVFANQVVGKKPSETALGLGRPSVGFGQCADKLSRGGQRANARRINTRFNCGRKNFLVCPEATWRMGEIVGEDSPLLLFAQNSARSGLTHHYGGKGAHSTSEASS